MTCDDQGLVEAIRDVAAGRVERGPSGEVERTWERQSSDQEKAGYSDLSVECDPT